MQHFYVHYPDNNAPFCPSAASWYHPLFGSLKTKKHQELQKKYNELEAKKNALENENTALNILKNKLEKEKTALNEQKNELKKEKTALNEQKNELEKQIEIERKEEKDNIIRDRKKYFRLNMAAARYFWLEYHQVSLKWKKTLEEPDITYTEITGENVQKLEETLKRRFEHQDIVCLQEEELIQFSISDPFKKIFIKSGPFYYVTLSLQMGDGHKELLCKKINQQILNAAYNSLCSWALRAKLQKLQEELEYKKFHSMAYDIMLSDFVKSIQEVTNNELSDSIDKIDSEERDFYHLLCQIYFGMSLLEKIASLK